MTSSPNPEDLIGQLTAAVAELYWMSETDAPFDIRCWPVETEGPLSPSQVLAAAQLPSDTPIEVLDLDTLLAPVIAPQPWYGPDERAIAERFQALQTLLHEKLEQLQVYRCGSTELDLYILGKTSVGNWIALHTIAIES
jgi:hypothetical protein